MSNYDAREERGRFLLRALLCLIFICAVAGQVLYYEDFTRETGLYMAAAVLPTAVALWALHRGSWPGLVVFFIGSFNAIANVTGALAEGGRAAMGGPDMVVGFIDLLLRLTVVFCALRSTSVSQYLLCRRPFHAPSAIRFLSQPIVLNQPQHRVLGVRRIHPQVGEVAHAVEIFRCFRKA